MASGVDRSIGIRSGSVVIVIKATYHDAAEPWQRIEWYVDNFTVGSSGGLDEL